jgi:phosphoribosylaminoimidazole-succinocarboxamide synthase
VVLRTELPGLAVHRRGKVRDVYELGAELLIVATDRISAFDVVLPTGIPDKGSILTQMSRHWFEATAHIHPNHLLSTDPTAYPAPLAPHRALLEKRSMLVRRTRPIPIECVVRGYLYGSGWTEYQRTGAICGHPLPAGLREAEQLPEPLFTPATKEESGHDINISEAEAAERVGRELAGRLKAASLALYEYGRKIAGAKGIIIADTKFEFGLAGNELLVIDELLTPDSSRFWPGDRYQAGHAQPSYDKQFVRDFLSSLSWNKEPPGPELPPEVVDGTRKRYWEAFRAITGRNEL